VSIESLAEKWCAFSTLFTIDTWGFSAEENYYVKPEKLFDFLKAENCKKYKL